MNFEGIKGHNKQILSLQVLLNCGNLPHALLFTGTVGIGKKIIAKRFLGSIFCQDNNSPCLSCPICTQINNEIFPDFYAIKPNEKGVIPIGSEEGKETGSIRWLIEKLTRKSISGKVGIIIDGVDKISEEGQNALLKTIEEPSSGVHFVLISANRSGILPTILSRCMEIRFNPLNENDLKNILLDRDISKDDLDIISQISGGSMEIASVLSESDILDSILEICKSMTSFLEEGNIFDIDFASIQKVINTDIMIDIMINIFRQNLLFLIENKNNVNIKLKNIFLLNIEKVLFLMRIMIALKKIESHNVNIRNSIKGMLYSFSEDTKYNNNLNNLIDIKFASNTLGG